MRRELILTFAVLVPMAFPLACGSLEEGEIVIVDGEAGTGAVTGGTMSGAGKGGTASGGRGGRGGLGDSGEGGGAGADGGSNPSGGNAGRSSGGSSGSTAGDTGYSGSAGATPTDCDDHSDCGAAAPICDAGQCRRCSAGNECRARDGAAPYCGMGGRCLECLEAAHCTDSSKPFCGPAGACRGCEENSDCASQVCVPGGRCAPETSVVYARADNGYPVVDCGTQTRPCAILSDTESKLSATRQYLVLMGTTDFTEGMKLPANTNVVVIGNQVKVSTYNQPAFTISGGDVVLQDVVAETQGAIPAPSNLAAVDIQGAKVRIVRSSIGNATDSYDASGLRLTDSSATILESKFHGSRTGLVARVNPGMSVATSLTVERSLFESNTQALDFNGDSFVIRNNLFLRNGQTSYVRIIKLQKVTTGVFSYNTLAGNDNNCSYEGGLIVCEGPTGSCGTMSSNISWGNMYHGGGGTACPDQVYENPPLLYYTIHEPLDGTMPVRLGTGNIASDPLFVNPGNDDYTPGPGSPAIGKGDVQADVVPLDDYYGNPRPLGDRPDIGAIEAE